MILPSVKAHMTLSTSALREGKAFELDTGSWSHIFWLKSDLKETGLSILVGYFLSNLWVWDAVFNPCGLARYLTWCFSFSIRIRIRKLFTSWSFSHIAALEIQVTLRRWGGRQMSLVILSNTSSSGLWDLSGFLFILRWYAGSPSTNSSSYFWTTFRSR